MAKPKSPGSGGNGDATARPRRGTADGATSVAGAQEATFQAAQQGRPGGAEQRTDRRPTDTRQPDVTKRDADGEGSFVNNVLRDPASVAGLSAQEIAQRFNEGGFEATIEQSSKKGTSGNAVQVRISGHPEITNIQVHPGGGRHTPEGTPYWKISTSTEGKIWIVPREGFAGAEKLRGKVIYYD